MNVERLKKRKKDLKKFSKQMRQRKIHIEIKSKITPFKFTWEQNYW